ncbi:MAG: VCBS repeat-containing protein, partial [Planctomycetota bacterium]
MLALLSTGLLLALPFQQAQRSDALATRPLFVDPHEFLLPSDLAPANFALGDVDVDGDVDVLALETFGPFESYRPKVWRNEGGGRLRRGPEIEFPFLFPAHVELVDLDGDLDLDALVGEYLLVNTGSLRFALDPVPQPFALQTERTFADFDGDGAKDALFAATGTAVLLLNDGLGHFSDAFANLPFGLPATDFVASGDVDGDLDADLLAGAFGATYLLLNDGTGVFTDASGNLPATTTFGGFELADVDGDLDLDALAFGELWTNDGSGVFIDASAQLPGTSGAGGTLLDLEGDGDPDLLAGDRVLVNDGSGVFALAPALVPALPGF